MLKYYRKFTHSTNYPKNDLQKKFTFVIKIHPLSQLKPKTKNFTKLFIDSERSKKCIDFTMMF